MFSDWWPSGTAYFFPVYDVAPTIVKRHSELSSKEFPAGLPDWDVALVAGDDFERIDIYNISETGFVVGPGDCSPFIEWSVDGLLDAWLNVSSNMRQDCDPMRDFIEIDIPLADHKNPSSIAYTPSRIVLKDYWKDASLRYYTGDVDPDEQEKYIFAIKITSPNSRWAHFSWPKPLTGFFPFGSTGDDHREQHKMVAVAKKSATDPQEALYEARNESKPYLFDGYTTREAGWYWPTLLDPNAGEEALRCRATNFGLPFTRTLNELRGIKKFQELLEEKNCGSSSVGDARLFLGAIIRTLRGQSNLSGLRTMWPNNQRKENQTILLRGR
jgi:hypothetical protein